MSYCALLTMFGIRDLAQEEPNEFQQATNDFQSVLQLCQHSTSKTQIWMGQFGDSCFIEEESYKSLYNLVLEIRKNLLLKESIFIHGAIRKGSLEALSKDKLGTDNQRCKLFEERRFGINSTYLSGQQQALKGIGISIDHSITKKDSTGTAWFENVFLRSGQSRKYESFNDIPLTTEELNPTLLKSIISRFHETKIVSTKTARFFVPILVNWIKHMRLSETASGMKQIDEVIAKQELEEFRNVVGFELVYLSLLNRIYSPDYGISSKRDLQNVDSHRIQEDKVFLNGCKWIDKYLHSDGELAIPEIILSPANRRRYAQGHYAHISSKAKRKVPREKAAATVSSP